MAATFFPSAEIANRLGFTPSGEIGRASLPSTFWTNSRSPWLGALPANTNRFPSGAQCAVERLILSWVSGLDSPAPVGSSVNCTGGFGNPPKTNFLSGERANPNPSLKRTAGDPSVLRKYAL